MRHGPAVDKNIPLFRDRDSERPLTEDGIKKVAKAAKGLKKIVPDIACIFSSPLKRAFETAIIVAQEYGFKKKIEVIKELAPGGSMKMLALTIAEHKACNSILLVGHEPDLSVMIGFMLGSMNISIVLKKGAVARLDMDGLPPENTTKLVWLMQPKQLRAIR